MKRMRISLLMAAIAVVAAIAWYQVQPAFAEDHHLAKPQAAKFRAGAKFQTDAAKPQAAAKGDDAVIAEQKGSYPLETCVVMGEKLGEHGPAYDYVYKGRLVRLCCESCDSTFNEHPKKYLGKLDAAVKEKAKPKADTKQENTSSTHAGIDRTLFDWTWTGF